MTSCPRTPESGLCLCLPRCRIRYLPVPTVDDQPANRISPFIRHAQYVGRVWYCSGQLGLHLPIATLFERDTEGGGVHRYMWRTMGVPRVPLGIGGSNSFMLLPPVYQLLTYGKEKLFSPALRNKRSCCFPVLPNSQSIYACPAYVNESYRSNPVCPT